MWNGSCRAIARARRCRAMRAVLGMDRHPGAEAQRLFGGLAGELAPELVEDEVSEPSALGHPHHHRRVLGHVAEARFALAQLLRGRLAPHLRQLELGVARGRSARGRRRAWSGSRRRRPSRPSTRASSPARAESTMTGRSRKCGSSRSARSKPKPSRFGIITSVSTRSGRSRRIASSAAAPSATVSTCQRWPSSRRDVGAHVGVVVRHQDPRAAAGARAGGRVLRAIGRRLVRRPQRRCGSQRSASSTIGVGAGAAGWTPASARAERAPAAGARRRTGWSR